MKRAILIATLFSLITGGSSLAAKEKTFKQQQFAVYYVNMQEIINNSNKGKQAKAILESKITKAREEIKKREKEINKLKEELKSPVLSAQAKTDKERQLQQKIRDLRRFRQDAQIEIANLEKQYTMEIINEVVKLINNYRKEKNIPMIVEVREAGVITADPKYDLTQTIIKLYNKQARQ
ncbi:outer membrane chaperone Skp (OmpH) [Desulfurobacterium thermolithotrophum DSM 11699]|uniref:Outer membrane chaperone Skp (OmpH) n=1 Tax=Desulfurobacterium thermolithotrophum (strain DSM 11699 / BSA) TaxID=868864 RepID=F0S062_DESTD|nr:OmpH family outer membrane protein [Desulfurobacterium thermolithotrophum]ADY73743.1 outer membrane chaperone Skp (OmpH) [Desulfurobacterium thermolithotrophum DSM 11699]